MTKTPNVLVIGGGTGTYTILTGLKKYPVHLSAIISMTDSGGSNRVIRDEFGLLPTSDLRQCITALADEEQNHILRELFTYRYNLGTGISGMTFGNLFMAALTDILGSQKQAIEETCKILGVKGQILPVTYDNSHLVARYENGKQVLGEHYIDEPDENIGHFKILELETIPQAQANPDALKAIKESDLIIMGPGDLYTSTICNLVVNGIANAIKNSKAKKVYVLNLMTKFGQTNNFKASDHIQTLDKYLGPDSIDYLLINNQTKYPPNILKRYLEEKSIPVIDDLNGFPKPKIIRSDFVSEKVYQAAKSDFLKRSLIRHDPSKLAEAIFKLIK